MSLFGAYLIILKDRRGREVVREWNGHGVCALGHPVRWVLQSQSKGIRVRRLGSGSNPLQEVTEASLSKGKTLELEDGNSLFVKGLERAPAAFEQKAENGTSISLFTCVNDWTLESRTLAQTTRARAFGTEALELSPAGKDSWSIRALVDGVRAGTQTLARGEEKRLSHLELVTARVEWGAARWHFAFASAPEAPAAWSQPLSWRDLLGLGASSSEALDLREFRRAMGGTLAVLTALMLVAVFWPKPQVSEEEIIPPQFAQVVMKPAAPAAPAASESAAAPRKAQDTAVAQAFRSQALNSAVSGLLKGGMSKLLSQSNLMVSNPSQTRALFGSKSNALQTSDVRNAVNAPSDVKVAAVGGTGAAGGYAKGGAAGVAGQGGGQVSLDLADSQVEEGLTKDEVGEVIHKHLSEIRYCYETALMRTSELEGKMLAAFVIGGNGLLRTSTVKNSTLNDARLEDCILRRLNSWKFPKPKGGVDVPVTYPFVFKTLGR
jgi:hypothetical protein